MFLCLLLMAWVGPYAQASFFAEGLVPVRPKAYLDEESQMARGEATIDRFYAHFHPIVRDKGGELVIVPMWHDERMNARALRTEGLWKIEVYGGLLTARLNEDEITLVLCHELGHHLGGQPTAARNGWSASEGQADYWSTAACASLLREPEQTALQLTRYYAREGGGRYPELDTKDEVSVARTFYGYPNAQCRLDTLMAGMKGMPRPGCWYAPKTP